VFKPQISYYRGFEFMAAAPTGRFEMRTFTIFTAALLTAAPVLAVQVVVGGTQSTEGFPFYGC
jgi:hypothetical protein